MPFVFQGKALSSSSNNYTSKNIGSNYDNIIKNTKSISMDSSQDSSGKYKDAKEDFHNINDIKEAKEAFHNINDIKEAQEAFHNINNIADLEGNDRCYM